MLFYLFIVLVAFSLGIRLQSQRLLSSPDHGAELVTSQQGLGGSELGTLRNGIRIRRPSHHACESDAVAGIYHIAMGDIGGAAGTIFFQFVIAQIMYAERHGLKPWVHFSNVSNVVYDEAVHGGGPGVTFTALTGKKASYVRRKGGHRRDATPGPPEGTLHKETMHFDGTGVWEHYFEPISDFVPGDTSCENKLLVTMDLYLITPGLHGYADYAPRCWRYKFLPDYISKPHLGITEWLEPQRRAANRVVRNYIRPRDFLEDAAERYNPGCNLDRPCLGLHIRHSDKASGRRVIDTADFLPFAEAFVAVAGSEASIYLATDSDGVIDEINRTWPTNIRERIRTAGAGILRSSDTTAVFDLDGASQHHRANQEVIVEILALARCQFLVHGLSAVSESSIWINLDLHNASVNLEDDYHLSSDQFGQLTRSKLQREPKDNWVHPTTSRDVWPALFQSPIREELDVTNKACDGYDGVLLISSVGDISGCTSGFFSSILNQLIYAEINNLKPWVHLRPDDSNKLIFEKEVHDPTNSTSRVSFFEGFVEASSRKIRKNFEKSSLSIKGNGIWNTYMRPVSDFHVSDLSCQEKPLVELHPATTRAAVLAPWSVKAWRYDDLPVHLGWNSTYPSQKWFLDMRAKGSSVVKKYFQFQPYLVERANEVNQVPSGQVCLGVHLRNGEKTGKYREKISPKLFVPYIETFVELGGVHIYVSSDSHRAIHYLLNNLPGNISSFIGTQGSHVVRSTKLDWPLHMIESHHRVNSEALVDLIALSKCQLLLHGHSTLSEAVIYLNPRLAGASFNLEMVENAVESNAVFKSLAQRFLEQRRAQ